MDPEWNSTFWNRLQNKALKENTKHVNEQWLKFFFLSEGERDRNTESIVLTVCFVCAPPNNCWIDTSKHNHTMLLLFSFPLIFVAFHAAVVVIVVVAVVVIVPVIIVEYRTEKNVPCGEKSVNIIGASFYCTIWIHMITSKIESFHPVLFTHNIQPERCE